jgi:hypothetical protein
MGKTKSDEHGEYDPDAGSPHPVDPDEVNYEPCNAVLKYTFERYGERRYCSGMAVSNFGDAANYEHPQFCKHHQGRAVLMKQHEDNFKTGAHSKSHKHTFQYLPPHKQLIANDLYKSLLNESTYNFETEHKEMEIDVSDDDFAPDADVLVLDHPVPTEHRIRGKALWHAALDFITMESIKEEQFRVAAEETHEGRDLAIGETVSVVSVTEDGREITDTEEHHLNLPLSRMTKHYKEHMKFGGVEYDGDEESGSMGQREWVAVVQPDEPEPAPEATGQQAPVAEIDVPEPDGDD